MKMLEACGRFLDRIEPNTNKWMYSLAAATLAFSLLAGCSTRNDGFDYGHSIICYGDGRKC